MNHHPCHHVHCLIAGLCLFSLLAAQPSVLAQTSPPPAATTDIKVASQNTAFALDLYHRLAATPGDNVFFSPYSISTALAMTWAGARGNTAAQMAKTLHVDGSSSETITTALGALQKSLNNLQIKSGVTLALANSLWPQQDHPILPEYLKLIKDQFGSAVFSVDYKTKAEAARLRINSWVEDKTNQRIKDLLHPGDIAADTRLVLVNAIYFKGDWDAPFDAKATASAPFTLAGGITKPVALMNKKVKARLADLSNDPVPLQILALPYKNDALEFIALLPKSPDGLPALEKNLTAGQLTTWLGKLPTGPHETDVFLPKFKLTERYSLSPALKALGITDAFTDRADFSGMDGAKDLCISDAIHQAYVEVNEQGTEAAAATGVTVIAMAAMITPTFRADHPFLFLIRDPATGSILFMGRFAAPTE